jgi:hypothetical protein
LELIGIPAVAEDVLGAIGRLLDDGARSTENQENVLLLPAMIDGVLEH